MMDYNLRPVLLQLTVLRRKQLLRVSMHTRKHFVDKGVLCVSPSSCRARCQNVFENGSVPHNSGIYHLKCTSSSFSSSPKSSSSSSSSSTSSSSYSSSSSMLLLPPLCLCFVGSFWRFFGRCREKRQYSIYTCQALQDDSCLRSSLGGHNPRNTDPKVYVKCGKVNGDANC